MRTFPQHIRIVDGIWFNIFPIPFLELFTDVIWSSQLLFWWGEFYLCPARCVYGMDIQSSPPVFLFDATFNVIDALLPDNDVIFAAVNQSNGIWVGRYRRTYLRFCSHPDSVQEYPYIVRCTWFHTYSNQLPDASYSSIKLIGLAVIMLIVINP